MNRLFLIALLLGLVPPSSQAADFASEMMGATFKLFHQDSTSTCFLVRRDPPDAAVYLVTAGHALERTKGETAILVLREAKADGSYERRDFPIPIRRGDQPLWVRHERQDVAVLRLPQPLPVPVAALPRNALADEPRLKAAAVHLCSPLFVLTYPQRFEANSAGIPVARQGIFASPPELPQATNPTFLADFSTFAGDSGGPVFIPGTGEHPLVVGIVLAQQRHEDRLKSEYEERISYHPLGIGTVLHAHFIRETLEIAAKATAAPTK